MNYHRKLTTCVGLLLFHFGPCGGQTTVPATPQPARLKLTVHAALVDKELNVKPIPRFELRINSVGQTASALEVRTALDGTAEVELPEGNYRVESVRPLSYQGKAYSWRVDVSLTRAGQSCELTNDNAIVTSAPESVTGPLDRSRDNLTEFYQKYRDSVVTVWSEIGQGTGFIFDQNGLILTNQHVIGASDYVAVQLDEKRKVRATVIAADPERDIAVLLANLDAFAGQAIVAPLWKPTGNDMPIVEGERVLAIGSPLGHRKIMTTGIVSKVEKRAIIADVNINHGSSGGPLFNSVGQVVGITTFGAQGQNLGSTIAGVIRIEEAYPLIGQARLKLATTRQPNATLLPVEPLDAYPVQVLKKQLSGDSDDPYFLEALKHKVKPKNKFDPRIYFFAVGDFYVQILTPPLIYRSQLIGDVAGANQAKRLKKSKAELQAPNPLDGLRNWLEYVDEDRKAVVEIHAWPKLHEKFLSAFSRAVAAANGQEGGPAQLKFKGDFQQMRLLCNDKEIEPIQPGKVAFPYNISNRIVQVADAAYQGFYTYPPDAMSLDCKMTLEITSAEKPDKPRYIELNKKLVRQVWEDFWPYFNSIHKAQP